MLGITTADAITLGGLIIGLVTMFRGSSQGQAAKQQAINSAPLVSIAGGIVDANQFADYVKVGDKLAIAIDKHADALNKQHDVKFTNALEELASRVDDVLEARREHPHRRK
jgi:hypothetical protein